MTALYKSVPEMKERPIIFNGEMVRAILDGRKTQTRRVVRPQPPMTGGLAGYSVFTPEGRVSFRGRSKDGEVTEWFIKRPWDPGDLLYVRETWRVHDAAEADIEFRADGAVVRRLDVEDNTVWRASKGRTKWRPSIHMPKWAARIWLKVTDVRVERVQEMSFVDWRADFAPTDIQVEKSRASFTGAAYQREHSRQLWDSINQKRGFGWEINPWVWVVTFAGALEK